MARRPLSRRARRARGLAALAILALVAALIGALAAGSSPRRAATPARAGTLTKSRPAGFRAHRLAVALPSPLQDAAAVALPDHTLALFGGLDANDTSTTAVTVLAGGHVSTPARLPLAQHDAQAALLGGAAYIFGGGAVSSYDAHPALRSCGGRRL